MDYSSYFINHMSSEEVTLERQPLVNVTNNQELYIYKNGGYWHRMGTRINHKLLEDFYQQGKPSMAVKISQ